MKNTNINYYINKFRDEIYGNTELSFSEVYAITHVRDEHASQYEVDYKISDISAFRAMADSTYKNIEKERNNGEDVEVEEGNIGEGFFTGILGFISFVVAGLMIYKLSEQEDVFSGNPTLLQVVGMIIVIIGFNNCVGEFMNIMKIEFKKDSDNTSVIEAIKSISVTTNDTDMNKHIKTFFKKNEDMLKKEPSYNIKLTKHIDSFLKKQENFMLRSENIGMKNSVFNKKVDTSLNFFSGKNTMQVAKEFIIAENKYRALRTQDLTDKLSNFRFKERITGTTYEDIFGENGSFKNVLNELLSRIILSEPDVDSVFESIVEINEYLSFLEHVGFPEYRALKFELLFKNNPELLTFFNNKDRYKIKDEIEVIERLVRNFENCGDKDLSSQSVFVNEVCSTVGSERVSEKILNAYSKIITEYKTNRNEIDVNRVQMFVKMLNETIISKKEMTSKAKYNDILDNITIVVSKIFKYSDVTKKDLLTLYKKEIATNPDIVSNADYFTNNIRKVLDVVFSNLEERKANHVIVESNDNSLKKQEYIVHDQFLHKIADYEEEDFRHLVAELDTISSFVDNLIEHRKDNSIDNINMKKTDLFRTMIFFYIASSLVFLLDVVLKDSKKDGDDSSVKGPTTQDGGFNLADMTKNASSMMKKAKESGSGLAKAASAKGAKLSELAKNAGTEGKKYMEKAQNSANSFGKKVGELTKRTNVTDASATNTDGTATNTDGTQIPGDKPKDEANPKKKFKVGGLDPTKVSIYLAGWFFSVIVLYTYWLKMDTTLSYNITVKLANSIDIKNAIMSVRNPAKKLEQSKGDANANKKELYDSIVELLALQSKCNLLRFNDESVPFPTTEIILTLFLIFVCSSVIVSQNLLNNPFDAFRKIKMIKKSQENEEYINKRSSVHDYVKSLMKDVLVAKKERLNKIQRSTRNRDALDDINEKRTTINKTISNLDINRYTRNAADTIKDEFPSEWEKELVHTHDDYTKYKNETDDASNDDINVLNTTLDDADTILDQYETALNRLKKPDRTTIGGRTHFAEGGNPMMMMDPYGMNATNNVMREAMQDNYKLESMREMMKYTETEQNMLTELTQLNNSIVETDSAFANLSIAFVLIAFSVFVSYKLINNTLSFKSELFNGKLYGEGVCYN